MLNYKIYGSGHPIVILHGLFGMLDNWSTFARTLQENYQVILVDQRNHGKSFHSGEMSYAHMALDLQVLLSKLSITKAHFLGHSMGGKVAVQFAVDYPDSINRLVVVDISTGKYQGGHHDIFEAIRRIEIDDIKSRQDADEKLSLSIGNIAVRQFLLKNLARSKEGGFRWKANFISLYENYTNLMDAIKIEDEIQASTLFVRGIRSNYIPIDEEFEKDLLSQFQKAKIVDVDAGHWVHAEKPKELYEVVTDFLK